MKTTSGSAGFVTITGRLMRDSINSTFALAREDYPLPSPPPVPVFGLKQSGNPIFATSYNAGTHITTVTLTDNQPSKAYTNLSSVVITFQLAATNHLNSNSIPMNCNGINFWTQKTSQNPMAVYSPSTGSATSIVFGVIGTFWSGTTYPFVCLITITYYPNNPSSSKISYNDDTFLNP